MRDSFGRAIDYIRLSVTDRCNLRCAYCLPPAFASFAAARDVMTARECERLTRVLTQLGVSKIRLTGGEPTVRGDLLDIVARLAAIDGVDDLSLSTNGLLLERLAAPLAAAGLRRVNVSLDTLDAKRYKAISRGGDVTAVLNGVNAALAAGLGPVKLNVVVARGMNDDEIPAFVALTRALPVHVRFIELMPMGETGFFSRERRLSLSEMRAAAGPLEPLPCEHWPRGHGPAVYYRSPGSLGTVGFISALSCGFCSSCNRMRLSAKGVLIPCLDGDEGTDLLAALRGGAGDARIEELILESILRKPLGHSMLERAAAESAGPRFMCQVGG